jgi:CheY-like chemotaxis protein/HPt (histidine-containing phosphotransfer) domain-containing protein
LQRDVNVILSNSLADKPVRLTFVVDPAVPTQLFGDDLRLQQILVNLGGNAIKFTEHGEVNVQVRMVRDSAGENRVEFSVRDSGIGIDPQYIKHIFDGFTQADSSITRRFGGTGLGLAICQKLLRLMGGEIQVTSKLGEGSCFYFALDLPEVQSQQQLGTDIAVPDNPQRLLGMRILLVEDNKINQLIAKELLSHEGAEVTVAENGALGVEAVTHTKPAFDAVLMDLQMPVMDGLEATRTIRQDLGLVQLPIIAMTANVMQEDRDACFAVGINEHIGKPFELNHLVQVLLRLAGQGAPAVVTPTAAPVVVPLQFEPGDLDEAGALARVGGNAEVFATVLRAFAVEMQSAPEQLRTHLKSNALDLARRAMHTLKGLAGTVGARHLSLVSAQLEQALKAGVAHSDHASMLVQLQHAIDALSAKLTPLLESYQSTVGHTATSEAATPLNTAQFQSDLKVLCKFLDGANMLALNAHTAIQNNYSAQLGADIEPLDQAMLQFDFVSARNACDALLAKHCR